MQAIIDLWSKTQDGIATSLLAPFFAWLSATRYMCDAGEIAGFRRLFRASWLREPAVARAASGDETTAAV